MTRTNLRIATMVAALALLVGAGCRDVAAPAQREPAPRPAPAARQQAEPWAAVSDGVERSVLQSPEGVTVILYRFDPTQFRARLLSDVAAPKSVADWAATLDGDAVLVNGTYFHEDYSPSGFVAVDGAAISSRGFDLDKSGLISFVPGLAITDTAAREIALDPAELVNAAQSYPFLVRDGAAAVERDSGQLARRTFVGTDAQGRWYVGTVPGDQVSLYALARLLADADVEWTHVLNLDGGPSTGYVARVGSHASSFDSFSLVPNVIALTRMIVK